MIIFVMMLGALAVYKLITSVYIRIWTKNLIVKIRFEDDHLVCGEQTSLTEVVENNKNFPLPFVFVKFKLSKYMEFLDESNNSNITDSTYRNDVFSLLMYQRVTRKIPVKATRRGVYSIEQAEVVSSGIFMKDILVLNNNQYAQITVYPKRIESDEIFSAFSKLMGNVEINRQLYADPFAFRGIRDYVSTDPMNTINWKASARNGELCVNQYNDTICQEVCFILNIEPEGIWMPEYFTEYMISIVASLAQKFIEKNIQVSIETNGYSCFNNERVRLDAGCDYSHINAVNMALAMLDLSKGYEPVTDTLQAIELANGDVSHNKIYVLISQNKRKDVQLMYDRLTGGSMDSAWIIPYIGECEEKLDYCKAAPIGWEVSTYAD